MRAFNPWPVAETRLHGAQLRIWEARAPGRAAPDGAAPGTVVGASPAGIDVACGSGMLRITRLQAAGRNPLDAGQFAQRAAARGRATRHAVSAGSGARAVAAHAVARILREGVRLDAALQAALAAAPAELGPPVRSLSYGAVRGYYRHEAILGRLLSQPVKSLEPLVRSILSVALYELEDARTPEYAVVDAAVSTAKATDAARAGGLINAVLRRYLRERAAIDAEVARNPVTRHASPIWLADLIRADWPVRWTQLLAAGDTQAPMWLRVNAARISTAAYLQRLQDGRDRRARRGARSAGAAAGGAVRRGRTAGVSARSGLGPGPRGAVRAVPAGAVAGTAGARRLRSPRRQDRADRRTMSRACQTRGRGNRPKRVATLRENLRRCQLAAEVVLGDAASPEAGGTGFPSTGSCSTHRVRRSA